MATNKEVIVEKITPRHTMNSKKKKKVRFFKIRIQPFMDFIRSMDDSKRERKKNMFCEHREWHSMY